MFAAGRLTAVAVAICCSTSQAQPFGFDDVQLVEGAFGTSSLMARDYEKALVLVNVGIVYHQAETHKLPGTFCLLHRDQTLGPPVNEISLRQGEAAIMVRQ